MRIWTKLIFDETIVGTTDVFTSPEHNLLLGQCDKHHFHAVIDQVSGTTPSLAGRFQHSGDQRNWDNKNGSNELASGTLVTTGTNNTMGTDPGTAVGAGYGRMKFTLAGTNPVAHVKLYVTGRDSG